MQICHSVTAVSFDGISIESGILCSFKTMEKEAHFLKIKVFLRRIEKGTKVL